MRTVRRDQKKVGARCGEVAVCKSLIRSPNQDTMDDMIWPKFGSKNQCRRPLI